MRERELTRGRQTECETSRILFPRSICNPTEATSFLHNPVSQTLGKQHSPRIIYLLFSALLKESVVKIYDCFNNRNHFGQRTIVRLLYHTVHTQKGYILTLVYQNIRNAEAEEALNQNL